MSGNLCFDYDNNFRMSSENYKENGYGRTLQLATISHLLCVWQPTRSRWTTERSCWRLAYLTAHMAWWPSFLDLQEITALRFDEGEGMQIAVGTSGGQVYLILLLQQLCIFYRPKEIPVFVDVWYDAVCGVILQCIWVSWYICQCSLSYKRWVFAFVKIS